MSNKLKRALCSLLGWALALITMGSMTAGTAFADSPESAPEWWDAERELVILDEKVDDFAGNFSGSNVTDKAKAWVYNDKAGYTFTSASASDEGIETEDEYGNVLKITKAKTTSAVDADLRTWYDYNVTPSTTYLRTRVASEESLRKAHVSYDLYLDGKSDLTLRFRDVTESSVLRDDLIRLMPNGKMNITGSTGEEATYDIGEWNHFDFYFDLSDASQRTYQTYVNNTLVASGTVRNINYVSCIDLVPSLVTDAYTLYVDNVRMTILDAFRLEEVTPATKSTNVNVMQEVKLRFTNPAGNADPSMFTVTANGSPVSDFTVLTEGKAVVLKFPRGLDYGTTYSISASAQLTDVYDQKLIGNEEISFTTMQSGFAASSVSFRNAGGDSVTGWNSTGVRAAAGAKNSAGAAARSVVLVTVVYDENNAMVKMYTDEATVAAGGYEELETEIDIPYESGYTVRSFLCEDKTSFKPLGESYAVLLETAPDFPEVSGTATVTLGSTSLNQETLRITGSTSQSAQRTLAAVLTADDGTVVYVSPFQTDETGAFDYSFNLTPGYTQLTLTVCGASVSNIVKRQIVYLDEDEKEAIRNAINGAGSASGVGSVMEANQDVLNMDSAVFNGTVYQIVYEQAAYATFEEFVNMAETANSLFASLNQANWQELVSLLSDNGDTLLYGVSSASTYAAYGVNARNAICRTIAGSSPFSSITQFRQVFANAVSTYQTSQKQGSTTSGRGGSGGYSSGTSGYQVTTPVEETNQTQYPTTPDGRPEFTDLDAVPWAQDAIVNLRDLGIVSADSAYRPLDNVTREEFVKLLVELLGLPGDGTACSFTDIAADGWYVPYLSAAQQAGIVQGNPDGSFGVGSQITREDMAVMTYRALANTGEDLAVSQTPAEFDDAADISDYAQEAVGAMQQVGVISGMGDNRFAPRDLATRAEAAVMIYNLYGKIEEAD